MFRSLPRPAALAHAVSFTLAVAIAPATSSVSAQGFARVDAAVKAGIRQGIYPGAVVVVGRGDTILYSHGYGRFTWSRKARTPDPATTLWDLASLSKVVGTTSAAAVLVDQGRLDLDAPVQHYLPQFTGPGKDQVTVRMLFDHTSGLPAYAYLYREANDRASAIQKLYEVPLERTPGISAKYSDLNAMLAGLVVERAAGDPLDIYVREAVFKPLGMLATTYRPPPRDRTRTAPSGRFRGAPVAGVVNDENARVLGGVAGHAGLFSTGLDLARFAQTWLRDSTAKLPWLAPATLTTFLTPGVSSGTRALGWDTPEPPDSGQPSLYGACATTTTVGHTGWTGTEIWLDRAQDLFVVFLTNRSYEPRAPSRSFAQLKAVRAKVADAAREAVGTC
jgi:CubicO group peptidase (beta-lactamase class C family)